MSLAVTYADLRAAIGHYLGYGRDPAGWTSSQSATVEEVLKRGLRRFYWPPPIGAKEYVHDWSFLTPLATLTLSAGDYDYDLPDDFASLSGPLILDTPDGTGNAIIEHVPERVLLARQKACPMTGPPVYAATRTKAIDYSTFDRYELLVWPTPDKMYVLQYRYTIVPVMIGSNRPNPPGGLVHGQTILEACLAEAEAMVGDKLGIHAQAFLSLLVASVTRDAQMKTADVIPSIPRGNSYRVWNVEVHP